MKYSAEERYFLHRLIARKIKIIDNKTTDAVSIQAKKKSWVEIQEAFNAVTGHEKMIMVHKMNHPLKKGTQQRKGKHQQVELQMALYRQDAEKRKLDMEEEELAKKLGKK
ncbi:hypothetical protein M8J77_020848 [Diaphorina citri]|nr:hypothetical protein M8J77_020848 [Diaphorina citri]